MSDTALTTWRATASSRPSASGGPVEISAVSEDLSNLSLDEIAKRIRNEHAEVEGCVGEARSQMAGALSHALRIGDLLLAARERVEAGNWHAWLQDNAHLTHEVAGRYQRVARYRPLVVRWVAEGGSGHIVDALRELRGLPAYVTGTLNAPRAKDPESRVRAKQLIDEGFSYDEAARLIGISPPTVREWFDPDYKKRQRQLQYERCRKRSAAKKALERAERDAAIKKVGGSVSEAYSLIRRCANVLDHAIGETDSSDEIDALKKAMGLVHQAEYRIVEGLQASRRIR